MTEKKVFIVYSNFIMPYNGFDTRVRIDRKITVVGVITFQSYRPAIPAKAKHWTELSRNTDFAWFCHDNF